ncbi:hypothetical protein PV327_002093 [Microctonus hyperodae]|uniref:Uncharacterized protein n=1 Tax=Microctonus hyperodae TaxID=165561 RepID=A0AA39FEU4_MICHY|nr:hypothetical protein PV327_002093 [Microctonus hyperodae]
MAGLFLGLLMIFQIIQQVVLINNNVNLTSMKDVFDYVNMLYIKDSGARKINPFAMKQLEVLINLTNYLTDLPQNSKYDSVLNDYDSQSIENFSQEYIESNDELHEMKTILNKYITNVEYWYSQSLENVQIGSVSKMRMINFVESVLESESNLIKTLFDINKLVLPDEGIVDENDFFSLIMKDEIEKYEHFCGRTSSQQRVYYILKLLIQTEFKGFIAISQAYYFDFISDRGKYLKHRSIREYEISMRATCMRLVKYFKIGNEFLKKFRRDVCQCDVENPQIGDNILELGDINQVFKNFSLSKIMRISTEPQISDIDNNMIVVGVKFINHDNVIHLQIKQRQISKNGFNRTDSKWKPVDVGNNKKTIKINNEKIFDSQKILYLDDINIDSDYVVTGVKFHLSKDGKGFELRVHSTKYNYSTGQLEKAQKWFGPGDHPIKDSDYQRERTEINLNNSSDSSIIKNYYPDLDSNKFIKFQHSLIKKGGGYHTIPYFDAQPVEVTPEFPLSGIGLFYRKDDRFGGSISPRLFTQYIENALESSFHNWKQLFGSNNISSSIKENEAHEYPHEYSSQWHESFKHD